jgi:hypothetical protein
MNYRPFWTLCLINFIGCMMLEVSTFALAYLVRDNDLLLFAGAAPYALFAFPRFLGEWLELSDDATFTLVFRVFNALIWSAAMLLLVRGLSWFYRGMMGTIRRKEFPKPNGEPASN